MPSKFTKILQEKKYNDHKRRMAEMKSSIDNAKPREMPLSMRNLIERKRVQGLIDQDNRLLLDRLAVAMSVKNIDNEPKKVKFISLGENVRKKELIHIMEDNARLLERIQTTVPAYNHVQWERDAQQRREYLKNMTEFPQYFVPPDTAARQRKKEAKLREEQERSVMMASLPPLSVMQQQTSPSGFSRQSSAASGGGSPPNRGERIKLRPISRGDNAR